MSTSEKRRQKNVVQLRVDERTKARYRRAAGKRPVAAWAKEVLNAAAALPAPPARRKAASGREATK